MLNLGRANTGLRELHEGRYARNHDRDGEEAARLANERDIAKTRLGDSRHGQIESVAEDTDRRVSSNLRLVDDSTGDQKKDQELGTNVRKMKLYQDQVECDQNVPEVDLAIDPAHGS